MTLSLLAAALVGALLTLQAGVNAELREAVGDPVATALVSFAVGLAGLAAWLLLSRTPVALVAAWSRSLWWQWTGGLLGAVYIAGAVVLAPRLGAATFIAAVVGGQMIASLVLDHFGLVGFTMHPITAFRVLGATLIVGGVTLVRW